MFLLNKYSRWYNDIISRAKTREPNFLGEWHHVIPASLGGSEIVYLTLREHFICHVLLIRMLEPKSSPWYKMVKALIFMKCHSRYERYTSRLYHQHRGVFSEAMRECQTGHKNSQFGTIWITNGTEARKIPQDEGIPDGWTKGRVIKSKSHRRRENDPNIKKRIRLIEKWRRRLVLHRKIEKRSSSLYKRYLLGESLRTLAKEYPHSWVQLHHDFKKLAARTGFDPVPYALTVRRATSYTT